MSSWMFDMLPEGAFEPRPGGSMRLHGSKGGGSSAPAPDPALIQAQIKSMGIQDSAIQRILDNSDMMAPLQKEQLQFGLDSSREAYKQSQDDRAWMVGRRGILSGMQDQLMTDAKQFNTEARQNELAAQAGADVEQAFESARGGQVRNLARMGITPDSGRALALENQTGIAKAAATAGARMKTRAQGRQEGYAMTDRAVNALAGYPAMGMSATGAGAGYGANGVNIANNGLAGMNSGAQTAAGMAGQMGTNASSMYGAQGNYKNGQDNANQGDSFSSILGGLGGAAMGAAKLATVFGSDRRLKENIVLAGSDPGTGLSLYAFNYKSNPGVRFIGVMADEVEPLFPDAVMYGSDGYASVDYGSLGIEMVEV